MNERALPDKPTRAKAYGSIPHLPESRMGPSDHHCSPGQARICTEKSRDKHDVIHVQEKLDGSCTAVAKVNGDVIPLGRAGYGAWTSPDEQHRMFASWVWTHIYEFDELLKEGERLVGEWLAQAHGTRYELHHAPWVVFDLMEGTERAPLDVFNERVDGKFPTPFLISSGPPMSVEESLEKLGEFGHHGALDPIEGVVYRVERRSKVDFLAKYVRPDKEDGSYLPNVTGGVEVWNWGK